MKILFVVLIFLVGCKTIGCKTTVDLPPEYKNQPDACKDAERCRYQNQFKTIAVEDCSGHAKECSTQRRYLFCGQKENRWVGDTEQNCWDKLNSK